MVHAPPVVDHLVHRHLDHPRGDVPGTPRPLERPGQINPIEAQHHVRRPEHGCGFRRREKIGHRPVQRIVRGKGGADSQIREHRNTQVLGERHAIPRCEAHGPSGSRGAWRCPATPRHGSRVPGQAAPAQAAGTARPPPGAARRRASSPEVRSPGRRRPVHAGAGSQSAPRASLTPVSQRSKRADHPISRRGARARPYRERCESNRTYPHARHGVHAPFPHETVMSILSSTAYLARFLVELNVATLVARHDPYGHRR